MGTSPLPSSPSQHPRLSPIHYPHHDPTTMLLTLSQVIPDDVLIWRKSLDTLTTYDVRNLLIPTSYRVEKAGLCSSMSSMSLEYGRYSFSLFEEIVSRQESQAHYNQCQIFYIIYSLARTAAYFEPDNISLGVISSPNILLNQMGHLKLVSIYTSPLEIKTFCQVASRTLNQPISPEELKSIRDINFTPKLDHSLTDAFSIGIVALEAALLLNSRDLFDSQRMQIHPEMFEHRIKTLRRTRSSFLSGIIESMLQIKTSERSCCGEVKAILQSYQVSIEKMIQFNPTYDKCYDSLLRYKYRRDSGEYAIYHSQLSTSIVQLCSRLRQQKPISSTKIERRAQPLKSFVQRSVTRTPSMPLLFKSYDAGAERDIERQMLKMGSSVWETKDRREEGRTMKDRGLVKLSIKPL